MGLGTARAIAAKMGSKAMTGLNVQAAAREVAGVGKGAPWEAHHTVALKGRSRTKENWRNHPALIKVLPTVTHKRLHGSYLGQPRFGPLERAWYGTTGLMKAVAAGAASATLKGAQSAIRNNNPSSEDKR